MTGVAAQMCGCPDPAFKLQLEQEMPGIEWGARKAILNDLSPAATFISSVYNAPVNASQYVAEARAILTQAQEEYGWMYETNHVDSKGAPQKGIINYTVWSDVFVCPNCSKELIYWDVAVKKDRTGVSASFICPHCGSQLKKADCSRAWISWENPNSGEVFRIAKQVPTIINYFVGRKKYEKRVDEHDLQIIEKINGMQIAFDYPHSKLPGEKFREPQNVGISQTDLFYTRRNLYVLSCIQAKAKRTALSNPLMFLLTSVLIKTASKLHNIGLKMGQSIWQVLCQMRFLFPAR